MSKKYRILVGVSDGFIVTRCGMRSENFDLSDGWEPEEARRKGAEAYRDMRRLVGFERWLKHRMFMAAVRKTVSNAVESYGDDWYPGPRPDLVALKPWGKAVYGEWKITHPTAARFLVNGTLKGRAIP